MQRIVLSSHNSFFNEHAMMSISCVDMGMPDCPFVAEGATEDEVMAKMKEHAMSAHNMTEADLMAPEAMQKAKAAMKTA